MKILFIGCVEFSFFALESILHNNYEVCGVVTKEKSKFNSDFKSLIPLCEKFNIKSNLTSDINSKESLLWIKEKSPDIIFCFGWSSLLCEELINIPHRGVVGFHPAALPQNRGRHPIVWALALGLPQTASTFFKINTGVDSGEILSQEFIKIDYEDDAKSLYMKIVNIALVQITDFCKLLESGKEDYTPQGNTSINHWRKRSKRDGLIDFRMSSRAIYNLVRSLSRPYVGAHIEFEEKDVKVWRVRELDDENINIEPGRILASTKSSIIVKVSNGSIELVEHDFKELPEVGSYL